MALIDKLTDLTSFDYNKVGETNTTDGRFEVNQKDNSGRVESLDDLPRPNIERNSLPPVVKGIAQATETALDVSTSTKGILFKAKQAVLHSQNASNETRVYDPTALEKSLVKNDNNFIELPRGNRDFTPAKSVSQTISYDAPTKTSLGLSTFNDDDKRPSRRMSVNIYEDNKSYGLTSPIFTQNVTSEFPEDFIKFYINDPIGKRIIQFPAYLTDISDNSSGEYNGTRYIGRADQVFVYSGYSRTISFGFRVAALTRGDVPVMWKKIDALKSLTLPKYEPIYQEQVEPRPVAPFVELTIGDLYVNQPGYFTSISTTMPQTSNWETEDGHQLTHLCDITLEYTFIGKQLPNLLGKQFDIPGYDKEAERRAIETQEKLNERNEFTKKYSSDTLGDIEYDFGSNLKKNATGQQRTQGFSFEPNLDIGVDDPFSTTTSGAGSLISTGGRGVGDIL
jgi:hypothetical protein